MDLRDGIWEVKAVAMKEVLARDLLNRLLRAVLGGSRWFSIERVPLAVTASLGWQILPQLGVLDYLDPDASDRRLPARVERLSAHTHRFLHALDATLESLKIVLSVLHQPFCCAPFRAFYTSEVQLYQAVYFPSVRSFLPPLESSDSDSTTSSHFVSDKSGQ